MSEERPVVDFLDRGTVRALVARAFDDGRKAERNGSAEVGEDYARRELSGDIRPPPAELDGGASIEELVDGGIDLASKWLKGLARRPR